MKRILAISTTLVLLFIFIVACGGGGHSSGGGSSSTSAARKFRFSSVGFSHFGKRVTTTASLFSPMSVFAATPVTVGNYTGTCFDLPQNFKVVVFNLGRYSDTHCSQNFASFSNDGQPVINAGTLTNLLATVSKASTANAGDGVVVVQVNGIDTALTCTVGTEKKCKGAQIVNVADGDQVTATFDSKNGFYSNVNITFDKQE